MSTFGAKVGEVSWRQQDLDSAVQVGRGVGINLRPRIGGSVERRIGGS